jgi:hypothetical protein
VRPSQTSRRIPRAILASMPFTVMSAGVLSLGCRDYAPAHPTTSSAIAGNLTADAARSLDENGQFILARGGHGAEPEITGERAKELAAAMWHDALPFVRDVVERDRGGPIHGTELRPCPRAYYVASAYTNVPPQAPLVLRKTLGPQWLVGLCYGDIQEVVISVSAYATDAETAPGRVRLKESGTANFSTMGVPLGVAIPTPPERIANLVAEKTKRRVAVVPMLTMRPRPFGAAVAVWQVGLEAPVEVKGRATSRSRPIQAVFAGHLDGWKSPALADARTEDKDDDGHEQIEFRHPRTGSVTHYNVTRRSGLPNVLELITVEDR